MSSQGANINSLFHTPGSLVSWGLVNVNREAHEHLAPAMYGNVQAAERLYWTLSKDERARFTIEMHRQNGPLAALRYFLQWTWSGGSRTLRRAAADDVEIVRMFIDAEFDIPDKIGETVRAYRGTYGVSLDEAAEGMSWTLDRDIACDFAYALGANGAGRPLVIEADIPREHVLMYANHTEEQELVVIPITAEPEISYRVAYPIDDWMEGHKRRRLFMNKRKVELTEAINQLANSRRILKIPKHGPSINEPFSLSSTKSVYKKQGKRGKHGA